jgi:hypothetical protein
MKYLIAFNDPDDPLGRVTPFFSIIEGESISEAVEAFIEASREFTEPDEPAPRLKIVGWRDLDDVFDLGVGLWDYDG